MKRTLGFLILLCVAAVLALRHTSGWQVSTPAQAARQTVLITMGLGAKSVEPWDGTARVTGGTLTLTEGRHFSADDAVTGPGAWKCVTRRDEVAPFADIHYTEMRPGSRPDVLFQPVGVFLTVDNAASARVSITTKQGSFDFSATEISGEPKVFLNGRAAASLAPAAQALSSVQYEDDEPSIAAGPNGGLAVAWVAYRERADRVLLRTLSSGSWSAPEEVTAKPGDIFRTSVTGTLTGSGAGDFWVFWSEREGERWHIWGRRKKGGAWRQPVRVSGEGSNTFHRAASSPDGRVAVVWQSFRGRQSDIYVRTLNGDAWAPEIRMSESPANDWEPAVAMAANGAVHVAWDSYDKGNYDIFLRSVEEGRPGPLRAVTSSPNFQAHASVAVDAANRPWVAWNESGVNWGKDQGFLITVPLSVPLHQERWIRMAAWSGSGWQEVSARPDEKFPEAMRRNAEHPQIAFDGQGTLTMLFRHWTRRVSRSIGSPLVWENYLTRLDGDTWAAPQPLPHSGGSIEKHPGIAHSTTGELWAAWMTDNRPFATMVPENAEIYTARLGAPRASKPAALQALVEPFVEEIPVHAREADDVKAIRNYSIANAGKQYKIYRGDMHRHTDVSQDFKYDGSLIEVYRYGFDAAGFDYIAPTDHQTGFDQEFTWWQNQKLVDLFLVSGSFTPLFAYERSLRFPNGHRNIVFAQRGVRTFPVPPEERDGKEGAAKLFAHLRENRGISMPHSSATAQGTNWRDNDPEVEPLMEIYQGYRTSYEYEGAPRAASTLNQHAQKSGWEPSGFWWNALEKGYKIGVQSSSDHWSTHISYACLITENFTREGLMDAIRKRHAYAATDNIVLDFRARSGEQTYIMGDVFTAQQPPRLSVRAIGTGTIKQIDIVKNRKFVYTVRPGAKEVSFEFTDKEIGPGESYYYVRVLQEDGQLAWGSPVWVKKE
ncbi:MAG: DUF3604 domain-containing protein [Bryobacteraceae bacterium]